MNTSDAVKLLASLDANTIRRRLTELDAEQRALRTLLRAAMRLQDGVAKQNDKQ